MITPIITLPIIIPMTHANIIPMIIPNHPQ